LAETETYAGPGGWNDPDKILIGHILWNGQLSPTPLTPDEQYTYMTLWSIAAAPLVFGGDMTRLDPFTLSPETPKFCRFKRHSNFQAGRRDFMPGTPGDESHCTAELHLAGSRVGGNGPTGRTLQT